MKLSICIASKNRQELLEQLLADVIPQLRDDVELLVVDSSERALTNVNWYYHRPELRMAEAYHFLAQIAHGEFVWFFTDDDLVDADAVSTVLAMLSSLVDLVLIDTRVKSYCLDETLLPSRGNDVQSLISYVGSVVIRRKAYLARTSLGDVKENPHFWFVPAVLQCIKEGKYVKTNSPLITIRYGNATWTSNTFNVFHVEWARVTETMGYPSLQSLIILRARGLYSMKEFNEHWKFMRLQAKWAVRLIALFPQQLTRWALLAYATMFKNPSITLYDLKNEVHH